MKFTATQCCFILITVSVEDFSHYSQFFYPAGKEGEGQRGKRQKPGEAKKGKRGRANERKGGAFRERRRRQ